MVSSFSRGLRNCLKKIDFKPTTQQPGPLQLNSTLFHTQSTDRVFSFFFCRPTVYLVLTDDNHLRCEIPHLVNESHTNPLAHFLMVLN